MHAYRIPLSWKDNLDTAMSLNKKHFDIVTALNHSNKSVSELATIFSMSSRNVRYAIDNINYYFEKLELPAITIDHGSLHYGFDASAFFSHHFAHNFVFSKEERDEYIAIIALFHPQPTVSHIRDYLKISHTTFNKDIKRVNEVFNYLAINITLNGDNICVTGKEKQIRYIAMRYASKYVFFKNNTIHYLDKSYFYEQDLIAHLHQYFEKSDVNFAITAVNDIERQFGKTIEPDFKNILTIYLIITLMRINQGVMIDKKNNGDFLSLTQLYPLICRTLNWQQQYCKYEALHLTEYFLGGFNTESFFEKRFQAESFIYQLLITLDGELNTNLVTDTRLISDIISYLTTAVYRAKNNLTLSAFEHSDAGMGLFHQIKRITEQYQQHFIEPLRDEEISYITQIIHDAIARTQDQRLPLSQLIKLAEQNADNFNYEQFISDTLATLNPLIFDDRDLPELMAITHSIEDERTSDEQQSLVKTIKWLCDKMEQKQIVHSDYAKGVLSLLNAHSHDYFAHDGMLICHGKSPTHSHKLTITLLVLDQPLRDAQGRSIEQLVMITNIDNVRHLRAVHQLQHFLNQTSHSEQ